MRGAILDSAKNVINGSRQDQYGNPEDSFDVIAKYWNVYLSNNKNRELTGYDVAILLSLMKMGRITTGAQANSYKQDSYIDLCGYIALASDMVTVDSKETDCGDET